MNNPYISSMRGGSSGESEPGESVPEQFVYNESVLDDGTFTLPTITTGAFGTLLVGNNEERADFSIDTAGTIFLEKGSSNIVTNVDTDAKVCLGTSVANPVIVKNRMGSTKRMLLILWYN